LCRCHIPQQVKHRDRERRQARGSCRPWYLLIVVLALTGCGSGGRSAESPPSNDPGPIDNMPQDPIQGVATPSTVSVVTATNAD
jgi:hypothetical protein